MLVRQQKLVEAFRKIYDQIRSMQLPMDSKVKSLQYLLRTPKPLGFSSWFEIFRDEFYLPLNPDRNIIGISHGKLIVNTSLHFRKSKNFQECYDSFSHHF